MVKARTFFAISFLGALCLVSFGCSRNDANAKPAVSITETPGAASGATVLGVNEFDFSIQLNTKTLPAGNVKFDLPNTGSQAHQLLVLETNDAADKLPLTSTDRSMRMRPA